MRSGAESVRGACVVCSLAELLTRNPSRWDCSRRDVFPPLFRGCQHRSHVHRREDGTNTQQGRSRRLEFAGLSALCAAFTSRQVRPVRASLPAGSQPRLPGVGPWRPGRIASRVAREGCCLKIKSPRSPCNVIRQSRGTRGEFDEQHESCAVRPRRGSAWAPRACLPSVQGTHRRARR